MPAGSDQTKPLRERLAAGQVAESERGEHGEEDAAALGELVRGHSITSSRQHRRWDRARPMAVAAF